MRRGRRDMLSGEKPDTSVNSNEAKHKGVHLALSYSAESLGITPKNNPVAQPKNNPKPLFFPLHNESSINADAEQSEELKLSIKPNSEQTKELDRNVKPKSNANGENTNYYSCVFKFLGITLDDFTSQLGTDYIDEKSLNQIFLALNVKVNEIFPVLASDEQTKVTHALFRFLFSDCQNRSLVQFCLIGVHPFEELTHRCAEKYQKPIVIGHPSKPISLELYFDKENQQLCIETTDLVYFDKPKDDASNEIGKVTSKTSIPTQINSFDDLNQHFTFSGTLTFYDKEITYDPKQQKTIDVVKDLVEPFNASFTPEQKQALDVHVQFLPISEENRLSKLDLKLAFEPELKQNSAHQAPTVSIPLNDSAVLDSYNGSLSEMRGKIKEENVDGLTDLTSFLLDLLRNQQPVNGRILKTEHISELNQDSTLKAEPKLIEKLLKLLKFSSEQITSLAHSYIQNFTAPVAYSASDNINLNLNHKDKTIRKDQVFFGLTFQKNLAGTVSVNPTRHLKLQSTKSRLEAQIVEQDILFQVTFFDFSSNEKSEGGPLRFTENFTAQQSAVWSVDHETKAIFTKLPGKIITYASAPDNEAFRFDKIEVSNTLLAEFVAGHYEDALTIEHYYFALAQEELQNAIADPKVTPYNRANYKKLLQEARDTWTYAKTLDQPSKPILEMTDKILSTLGKNHNEVQCLLLIEIAQAEKNRLFMAYPSEAELFIEEQKKQSTENYDTKTLKVPDANSEAQKKKDKIKASVTYKKLERLEKMLFTLQTLSATKPDASNNDVFKQLNGELQSEKENKIFTQFASEPAPLPQESLSLIAQIIYSIKYFFAVTLRHFFYLEPQSTKFLEEFNLKISAFNQPYIQKTINLSDSARNLNRDSESLAHADVEINNKINNVDLKGHKKIEYPLSSVEIKPNSRQPNLEKTTTNTL